MKIHICGFLWFNWEIVNFFDVSFCKLSSKTKQNR